MENKENQLEVISNEVVALEVKLQQLKLIQQQEDLLKEQLFNLLQEYDIKKWTTTNGVQITRVDGKEESIEDIITFNEDEFKKDHKDIYEQYLVKSTKINKGRKGYAKITLPKTIDFERMGE